ncbi:hypothetical protein K435DRAFT_806360 [Dendrothele bispora CBS 962.96]|uniref:Uncharacterized protein n=1 Tax=Dendrothele bispora (strain CBS 962.96) TaxID=1314807 RepID=A0A4S8L8K7_DENBC|nr:hypothetical protein K435DRAFT_806360 [Dendrothele bispora CBS 962.96]
MPRSRGKGRDYVAKIPVTDKLLIMISLALALPFIEFTIPEFLEYVREASRIVGHRLKPQWIHDIELALLVLAREEFLKLKFYPENDDGSEGIYDIESIWVEFKSIDVLAEAIPSWDSEDLKNATNLRLFVSTTRRLLKPITTPNIRTACFLSSLFDLLRESVRAAEDTESVRAAAEDADLDQDIEHDA